MYCGCREESDGIAHRDSAVLACELDDLQRQLRQRCKTSYIQLSTKTPINTQKFGNAAGNHADT